MIRLDRTDLRSLAEIFVLANTPFSLLRKLLESPQVQRMLREYSASELEAYYDWITARAGRSELVIALAYAVLVGLLVHEGRVDPIDTTRLEWGPQIQEYLQKSGKATQTTLIVIPGQAVKTTFYQDSGAKPIVIAPDDGPSVGEEEGADGS